MVDEMQMADQSHPSQKDIGFPQNTSPKSKLPKWLPLILIIITAIVLIFAAWFILQPPKEGSKLNPTPTPSLGSDNFVVPTPSPTPTPKPEIKTIKREDISISILNGTGIPKEAGFLQGELEKLGYSEIETGNASKQDYKSTEVTFNSDLSSEIRDELTKKLKGIYNEVVVKESGKTENDVVIITGTRKGVTPQPTPTPTPTTTPTPTPSPMI